jgi:EmrB/QacA subfamily drug resistance transporter
MIEHRSTTFQKGSSMTLQTYSRRWIAAVVMMVAAMVDLIDGTIVNVALPTIRRDLHAGASQVEWVVSAYMLAFAAVLITAGSLGDLFGRRRLFVAGTVAFGLASLSAGVAGTPDELIAARVVQGVAAAVMSPQVLATFRAMFAGKERGMAFGIYGAVLGFASAIGLVLGGVLTDANLFGWGWRTIFLVNVPITAAAAVATLWVVPETRARSSRRPDLRGAAVLTAALVAIVYPILEGRRLGWPAWGWGLVAAGLAAVVGLALAEARAGRPGVAPLLRPRLLRTPAVTAGLIVQLAFSVGLQGFALVFALWVQLGQGYTPLRAGLTMLAFSAGSFLAAPFAIPLAQRFGRLVLVAGALLMAAGTGAIDAGAHRVGAGIGPWPLVPGLVLSGIGLAFLVIPLVNVVLAAVPAHAAGGASGLFGTAQQLGGAIGVAVMGTIFFGALGPGEFKAAFEHTAPYLMATFALAGVLCLVLPDRAVDEDAALEAEDDDEEADVDAGTPIGAAA